jgi:hypothetical protein
MSIFGWSLPPGCGELPGEGPDYCGVCGREVEARVDPCECIECPVCGEAGNPDCYTSGHLPESARPAAPWEPELDAYGHLTWTIGDEDWVACLDFDISPDGKRYAYHVVLNCESGGFIDTLETGEGPIAELGNIRELASSWYGDYIEYGSPKYGERTDAELEEIHACNARTIARWEAEIDSALARVGEDSQ